MTKSQKFSYYTYSHSSLAFEVLYLLMVLTSLLVELLLFVDIEHYGAFQFFNLGQMHFKQHQLLLYFISCEYCVLRNYSDLCWDIGKEISNWLNQELVCPLFIHLYSLPCLPSGGLSGVDGLLALYFIFMLMVLTIMKSTSLYHIYISIFKSDYFIIRLINHNGRWYL